MSTHERARLGPVAAAVFAVWLTANLIAGVDGIEQRFHRAADFVERVRRVATLVMDHASDADRAPPADRDDTDEPHACR
jgi:hypothetical protein